ncbi:MAG TPA: dihydropteroate synthase [Gemmatimonadales bacterium]|nr:dihydropteroate synthase [Gemmatimonadales bacterium]
MNVVPLAFHSPKALRDALTAHGWDPAAAAAAAGGSDPLAFHIHDLDQATLESLVRFAGHLGLEVLTGDGWAILAGSRSRLSALARPWTAPEELRALSTAVGLAIPPDPATVWRTGRVVIPLERPVLMGILNVTPDSFSDGGRHVGVDAARTHAAQLAHDGATIVDVGGESTRPGRDGLVPEAEELRRVIPVIEAIVRDLPDVAVSVDTVKSAVARAALDAGAAIVNDVTALRHDPAVATAAARAGAGLVLMHSRGPLADIASYAHADYGGDPVAGVRAELAAALSTAVDAGMPVDAIVVDPGLGFSKTPEQNMLVCDRLAVLLSLGRPILVGPSRKRFIGVMTGLDTAERDRASATVCALAWERGARLFRVHDVALTREALAVAYGIGGP